MTSNESPLGPSRALEKEFANLTHHKLPPNFLDLKLAQLGKGGLKAEDEDTKIAFAALTKIMRTKVELGHEVVDYIALRWRLHKPFRTYLKETENEDLIPRLATHTIRRALL